MSLADQACVPCRGGVPPLEDQRVSELLSQLEGAWTRNSHGHLERRYDFRNFAAAMDFANRIAAIAEREQHHPDLTVRWGQCGVELWTHKISGLTESDFYLAAKIERAFGDAQNK